MEDEEYLPENSDLRYYLESLNLCDNNRENTVKQKTKSLKLSGTTKSKSKRNAECIDKDVLEQIEELLSGRMLFEEDIFNIERLLSNFKVVKVGMLRDIFENVSGFFVIVLGLCVYWIIGSYAFYIISIYYAYNAADYLWRKHFRQRCLRQLTEKLQENYNLFRKTLKFITDSDNIFKVYTQNQLDRFKNYNVGYEQYFKLKHEFARAESEIINILSRATKRLVDKFPFYEYIEDPQCYLCYRYEQQFMDCADVKKLYQIYLLVQSQFLQRLILSLIPNIKISGKDNYLELYKIIKETSFLLERLECKLSKKFKIVFLTGIESESNISLNIKTKDTPDAKCQYKNELITNLQDMSNSFQRLLIRSRNIENDFSNGDRPEKMEDQLADIQNELSLCQRNLSDSMIVLKKFSHKKEHRIDKENQLELVDEESIHHNDLAVDLMAETNEIPDEVFEAYITGENRNEVEEDYDFEDYLKKKTEREYTKLVLEELKTKIVEKAKVREMKEADALARKAKNGEQQECRTDIVTGEVETEDEKECANISQESDEKCISNSEMSVTDDVILPTPPVLNSEFLSDIFKARSKLIKTPAPEECFCDSGEEDED